MTQTELLPATSNGFEDTAPAIQEAGGLAVVAREQSEIQAAIISAKKFPRNEATAYTKVMNAMTRESAAKEAEYAVPRGKGTVHGASIHVVRTVARCWGNIDYGFRMVSVDDEYCHLRGYAIDLENNIRANAEAKFRKEVQRKDYETGVTKNRPATENETRELINRHAALSLRNCLSQVLPKELIEEALEKAKETMLKAAKKTLGGSRDGAIKKVASGFDELGISVAMIEQFLEHPISALNEEEFEELRKIKKSIVDGVTKREDYFQLQTSSPEDLKELNAILGGRKS